MRLRTLAATAAAACFLSAPAIATSQAPPEQTRFADDAFLDPVARELFTIAFDGWSELGENIQRYTARIDLRMAMGLRTPGRDRVFYHSETAVRAFWARDRLPIVQLLGARSRYPGRGIVMREADLGWFEELPFDGPFAPGSDQLFVGTGEGAGYFIPAENDYLAHPLGEGADTLYRFRSRDTTTITFPDGRRQAAVRLDVIPRETDPNLISGTLWIDPASGALVRGVYRVSRRLDMAREFPEEIGETLAYRLVPGFLKPLTVDVQVVAVDYSLWDFEMWLPRTVRYEGEVATGVVKMPISIDYVYRIESVTRKDETAAAGGVERPGGEAPGEARFETGEEEVAFMAELLSEEGEISYRPLSDEELDPGGSGVVPLRWIVPDDPGVLEGSPHIPPPIWENAPGFLSDNELDGYIRILAGIPAAPVKGAVWGFNWGWGRQDLLRYNRVEGAAVGGRFEWALRGSYSLGATGFFGFADRKPKVRVDVERSTVLRRLKLGVYHELRSTDLESGYLGIGNSLDAFLFGRDNGEYHGVAGVDLTWRPPAIARQSFSLRAYAERQGSAESNTGFALLRVFDKAWDFPPNLAADEVEEVGGEMRLSPWWGKDPERAEFGIELFGRSAVWRRPGDGIREDYSQASATVTAIVPVQGRGWRRSRIAVEAAGGHTWGNAPVQRSWFLGGPGSLRGYPASTLSGLSFLRGRAELAGTWEGFGGSLFGDAAWAGPRREFDSGDILYGIGVGASILDGVIRIDLSQGLKGPKKGFRIEVYLDAIL